MSGLVLNIWAKVKNEGCQEEMLTECQLKQCGENGKIPAGVDWLVLSLREKRQYLIYSWQDNDFQGTVVNRTCHFINNKFLAITFIQYISFKKVWGVNYFAKEWNL